MSQSWGQRCSSPDSQDVPDPGPGQECSIPRVINAPVLGSRMLQAWIQGCPRPEIRNAPSLGSLRPWLWGQGCSSHRVSGAPAMDTRAVPDPGSGMLHPWGQRPWGKGCSIPGITEALPVGSRPWGQGYSIPGTQAAPALTPGMPQTQGQGCPIPGIRSSPVPGWDIPAWDSGTCLFPQQGWNGMSFMSLQPNHSGILGLCDFSSHLQEETHIYLTNLPQFEQN